MLFGSGTPRNQIVPQTSTTITPPPLKPAKNSGSSYSERGQHRVGRCTCGDCSPLLLRMRCVLQDQNWVRTMLAWLNSNSLTSFPSTGERHAAPKKQVENWKVLSSFDLEGILVCLCYILLFYYHILLWPCIYCYRLYTVFLRHIWYPRHFFVSQILSRGKY